MVDLSGRRARVLSVSNRASAGVYEDTTGPLIVESLQGLGFDEVALEVIPDGDPVRVHLQAAVSSGVDVVVTTGGTGINPHDETPEMTRAVIERGIPGIAEAIRAFDGRAHV